MLLAATNADKLNCQKDGHGEFTSPDADAVLTLAKQYFWPDFDIVDHVFVMDAHLAMSPELKVLRTQIGETKARIVKVGGYYYYTGIVKEGKEDLCDQ